MCTSCRRAKTRRGTGRSWTAAARSTRFRCGATATASRGSRVGSGAPPVSQRRDDLLRRVLAYVVARAFERDRPVVGERPLPALALLVAEGLVARRPQDQGGL